jgi:hypothetical protein
MFDVIKDLSIEQRISLIRDAENIYPLTSDLRPSPEFLEEFMFYDNVVDLHLGQFIMLEQVITSNEKYKHKVDNDLEIAKLILRPKHQKEFDNEDKDAEYKNLEKILNSNVTDIYGCINKFMENREYVLFKQFSGVFYSIKDYEEEDEKEKEELVGEDLFHNQWYWYNIVRTLAQEDIRRYEEIYMLKMNVVLPEMSFLAQRSKIENMRNKKMEAQYKL